MNQFLSSVVATLTIASLSAANPSAFPHHQNPDEIVVTRGDKVLGSIPCERIVLDGKGRWNTEGGYCYTRGQVGRTSDGKMYARVGSAWGAYFVAESSLDVFFESHDDGRTWPGRWNVDLPQKRLPGNFIVLDDDSFLVSATQSTDSVVSIYRSTDRGRTWKLVSEIPAHPFEENYLDGNLLQLQDGTILLPLNFAVPVEDEDFQTHTGLEFVLRSTDRGHSWHGGPDLTIWEPLIKARLSVLPKGPDSYMPGGTFMGCYETGLAQAPSGRVLATLRFSGYPWVWHERMKEAWGGREPDKIGRIFRQVMFSASDDGGLNWEMMRPFADADGESVIIQQETNGQMVPLGDGRIVLIHQRRFGPYQLVGRVSIDGGKTWLHDEYRISAGFGYSGSVVLDDGTIVTCTGKSIASNILGADSKGGEEVEGRHEAQIIRWKLPPNEEVLSMSQSGS